MESILSHVFVNLVFLVSYVKWILMIAKVGTFLRLVYMRTEIAFTIGVLRPSLHYNATANTPLNNLYVYYYCVYTITEWFAVASQQSTTTLTTSDKN